MFAFDWLWGGGCGSVWNLKVRESTYRKGPLPGALSRDEDRLTMGLRPTNRTVCDANRSYYARAASHYRHLMGPREKTRLELLTRLSSALRGCGEPLSVLDIGTGQGFGLEVVEACVGGGNAHMVGCDVSLEMLKRARDSVPAGRFVLFDGLSLPFPSSCFDVVLLVSVLHHLYEPSDLLHECARVLSARGALVILQEPNPVVNGAVRGIREHLGLIPKGNLSLAEYHQFMTDGLRPEFILECLAAYGLAGEITFGNAALIDEIAKKVGRWAHTVLAPLGWLSNSRLCLSYSIVARRKYNGASVHAAVRS